MKTSRIDNIGLNGNDGEHYEMNKYVVIRDMSAGNETVGEMWQETKIFNADDTLETVMQWATSNTKNASNKHISITRPHDVD